MRVRLCQSTHVSRGDSDGSRWSERSERPPGTCMRFEVRPRLGSRIKYQAALVFSATPVGVGTVLANRDTGGRSLRSDHRLPSEPPPVAYRRRVCAALFLLLIFIAGCRQEPVQNAKTPPSRSSEFESLPSRNAYAGSASCKE